MDRHCALRVCKQDKKKNAVHHIPVHDRLLSELCGLPYAKLEVSTRYDKGGPSRATCLEILTAWANHPLSTAPSRHLQPISPRHHRSRFAAAATSTAIGVPRPSMSFTTSPPTTTSRDTLSGGSSTSTPN